MISPEPIIVQALFMPLVESELKSRKLTYSVRKAKYQFQNQQVFEVRVYSDVDTVNEVMDAVTEVQP